MTQVNIRIGGLAEQVRRLRAKEWPRTWLLVHEDYEEGRFLACSSVLATHIAGGGYYFVRWQTERLE